MENERHPCKHVAGIQHERYSKYFCDSWIPAKITRE